MDVSAALGECAKHVSVSGTPRHDESPAQIGAMISRPRPC